MENTENKTEHAEDQKVGHKKLYRSNTNKIFAGICAGLGEYLNVDVAMIRLVWTLVVIFTGFFPGALVYLIAIFLIPTK